MGTSGWGLSVTSHSDTVSDRGVVGGVIKEVVGVGEGVLEEVAGVGEGVLAGVAGVDTTRKSWAGGVAAETSMPGTDSPFSHEPSDCVISPSG